MDQNLKTYNSSDVVEWYGNLKEISPAEKAIVNGHMEFFRNAELLDIGVGGGRTTAWLSGICKTYTGIDYSESFVAACQKKFPDLNIRQMDARNMKAFGDSRFDVVNFSFNGLDYVGAEGRKNILTEIHRVLKPGGLFFFSTHNLTHPTFNLAPWKNPSLGLFKKIKTFIKILPVLKNKTKHKSLEKFLDDYAIINDSAHGYRLLTFYTSPAYLRNQLTESGFKNIQLYSAAGKMVGDEKLDDWIFATCVR